MTSKTDQPARVEPTGEERAAAARMLELIGGLHISRALNCVAELSIPDRLAGGPLTSAELAQVTQTHEPSLYRVLRLLAALGVLEELDPRTFRLTIMGDRLRSEANVGMRAWATFFEALGGVRPFAHILETVRTGNPGFDLEFGAAVFDYLPAHADNFATFNAAMSERTAAFAPSVATGYDFSDARRIVDLGGGDGTLLVEILRRHPHLTALLFDLPAVVGNADALLDSPDVADRCQVLAGDFFERVPEGADCYLLANVLHDWDDERCLQILRNCRRARPATARVLIIERLIPEDGTDPLPTLLSDINMLILTGGRERTNAEYTELLEAAGFSVGSVLPAAFPYGVIEGIAR